MTILIPEAVPATQEDLRSERPIPSSAGSRLPRLAAESTVLLLMVGVVLLIHGYHPWSDDAAIYIAGLRKIIDPRLFPTDGMFVTAHTKVSIFSHLLAGVSSMVPLSLPHLVLLAYIVSAWMFLYGCRRLSLLVFDDERVSWTATAIAAACFTVPVAGTALFVMDPYVTARSFSTPFSLLAIAAALERRWGWLAVWVLLTAAMHPQMGAYLGGFLVVLELAERRRWRAALALAALAICGCAAIWLATLHQPVTSAYREAVLSRTYFFPALWHWYEWMGLAGPLALMAVAWRRARPGGRVASLCATCILIGVSACIAAFALVHPRGPYFLARVQLLRSYQLIYVVGLVLIGGWIGSLFRYRRRWAPAVLFVAAAIGMYGASLGSYRGCAHIEWPGSVPIDPLGQAMVWIRTHTPANAVFAISPQLLKSPPEDMPGFRALAERSVLVDNKDEGVASIFPDVAPEWKARADAEAGLDGMTPAERAARLRPWGVGWLLIPASDARNIPCAYRNSGVVVCVNQSAPAAEK